VRVDDYKNAMLLAAEDLSRRDASLVAQLAGAEYDGQSLSFSFMNRKATVSVPKFEVGWAEPVEGEEFSLTDAVMILHYLQEAKGIGPTGEFLAYRQIPGGEFYTAAFRKRAELPLIGVFGYKPGLLTKAAEALAGRPLQGFGDESSIFRVLPNLEIVALIHAGDDEFPPDGQVLFDRSISQALSIEDIAWIGSAVVYRLMGAAKKVG
jgi:hypothetical protein